MGCSLEEIASSDSWGGAWIRKSLQCILSRVLKKLEQPRHLFHEMFPFICMGT